MRVLVFFLEEPSARAMLEGLLPRLLPAGWEVKYVIFEGKQDLEKQLPRKLLGDWHSPFHRKQSFPKFQKIHLRGERYNNLRNRLLLSPLTEGAQLGRPQNPPKSMK